MSMVSEIEKLSHDAIIELYEIDATRLGGDITRFHAGTNQLGQPIVWQGQAYLPRAVQMTGFAADGDQRPTPTMTIANINGAISDLIIDYEELVGATVTRIRTLAMFLDAVNFANGNPAASDEQLPRDVFYIKRRSSETDIQVEFELGTPDDAMNLMIPGQQITPGCTAIYRDPDTGCDWDPGDNGPFFNAKDQATNAANDQCSKCLSGCKARFGNAPLPFMGFPAAALVSS